MTINTLAAQKGRSNIKRPLLKAKPEILAPNPNESKGSVILEPIRVPREISCAFLKIPLTAVDNSGRKPPTPRMITPTKVWVKLKASDILRAFLTTKELPIANKIMPLIRTGITIKG